MMTNFNQVKAQNGNVRKVSLEFAQLAEIEWIWLEDLDFSSIGIYVAY
jgi:hypothetical protein